MTRSLKITGLILAVTLTATGCNFVHRNIRGMIDRTRMHRNSRAMEFRHMNGMDYGQWQSDGRPALQGGGYGMNGNGWRGGMQWMRRGAGMGPSFGMRRGMRPMGPGRMGPGIMGIERIPGLTDAQRKEIADLREKQMQEIDKLREETFAKMQGIREENRTKMMSLLNDEQKKFLESRQAGAPK